MPSAGDKIRASDIMHRIGAAARTTNLGGAVTVDTTLALDVAFVLTRTRRVRVEAFVNTIQTSSTATFFTYVKLRRNATGAPIGTGDALCTIATQAGALNSHVTVWDELLTAGTYAYGLTLEGPSGTSVNLNVSSADPATISVWDMGDV